MRGGVDQFMEFPTEYGSLAERYLFLFHVGLCLLPLHSLRQLFCVYLKAFEA